MVKSTNRKVYSGNSGGKDSAVLEKVLELSGIEYQSIYSNTTIDPKGTISHIKTFYPNTQIINPKASMYQLIRKKGFPNRFRRYCCEKLKEQGGINGLIFLGIRSSESTSRNKYSEVSHNTSLNKVLVYPIFNWTLEDIWDFIDIYELPIINFYQNRNDRLGCIMCPLTSEDIRRKQAKENPKHYKAFKKAITLGMKENPQWKLSCATGGDGDIAMEFWFSDTSIDDYFSDFYFFETFNGWRKIRK